MTAVSVSGLSKSYGSDAALAGLDLEIETGSFTVVTGPPKSGKSTLFRILTGLEKPDSGSVVLEGQDITSLPPARRRIGYVPQSFALYPHYSVRDNIAYPLLLAGAAAAEIDRSVGRAADMLSIGHLLGKTPDQLSGGEKQRTALARGLTRHAHVFVLDDPLVGLDYKLRERLMDDLKDLRAELDATFVYGTADTIEALTMASSIAVLDSGKLIQSGSPERIYRAPATARAMALLGFPRANLLDGASPLARKLASTVPSLAGAGDHHTLGIRPEAVAIGPAGNGAYPATVSLVEDLGSEIVVYLQAGETDLTAAFAVGACAVPAIGDQVGVSVAPDAVLAFDAAGGAAMQR